MKLRGTLLCALLTLLSQSGRAYVIVSPPLPAVPGAAATTSTTPNSAKTQSLIDQLFDKADYQDFSDETPSTIFDENPNP